MDSQDPRKNPSHTPGHESHGVYVCNKCGWPFPNPHPSARHRRAHRKICGTLKGYKFVDSEETPLSALSDDDHGSDEDPKTPSPKGLGRGINEKGSGGVGNRSNRSEDDVFTDAIAEFPESGSSSVTGEHTKDVKEPEINLEVNKTTAQSSEDGSITVISPPPSNSADHIQMQSTEVPVINLSESPQESLDHDLNATIASMSRTLTDCRAEQSGFEHSHDNRSSARDPIPIKLETQTDASQEKSVTVEDLPKTDAKGNEETKSEGQLLDVVDSTNDNAKDVSEVASKSQKMENVTSQPVPAAEVPQLKEGGYTDDLASGMSLNDHSPEVKSVEPAHSSISTAQIEGDAPQEIDSAVYANSTVTYDNKGEGNENVHVLVVPNDLTVVSDAENTVKGFKDLEGGKLPKLMNVDSFDVFNKVKDSDLKNNPQVLNSRSLTEDTEASASDMHVLIDNLEPKDGTSQHNVEELLDEAEADVPQISEVSVAGVVTGDLEKSFSVHSPEENVPRDHCDTSALTSSIEHATKVVPDTNTVVVPSDAEVRQTKLVDDEAEADVPQISEVSVAGVVTGDLEKSFSVHSPEENVPRDHCDTSSLTSSIEHATKVIPDTNTVVVPSDAEVRQTKLVGMDGTGNDEKDKIESSEIGVKDIFAENRIPSLKHVSIPSEQADQRNSLLGDVKATGLEEGKIERCNVYEIVTEGDSVSGLGEESLLREPNSTLESAVNVESRFTSKNEINVCEANLPQHASIPSEQADQRNRLHGDVKAAGLEEGKIERCNVSEIVTEGDSLSGLGEENLLRKTKTIPESAVNVESRFTSENEINVCEANLPQHASIPSDQADQRNRLHGDVIAAGLEEGKIERCNVSEIVTEGDSVSGLGEENPLRKPKTTPESAVNVESRFTSENEINVCEVKLPHHEHTDIGRVLDPQESRKEPESNGMANQQAEHAGEDSTAAESDSGGGDVEVLRKSSEEKMVREPLVSPSDPSSTLQNSSPVSHNQARDFPGVASGNTPESLPDEGVNYFATQQVVASATDFSADSISQTDSLEGHWGSVSVLSTQSDIPAILDAEPLPSNGSRASEAEEATLKKPIAASETEHADKSDIFDPPSVTALIEPRDVVNQKAAASEIQTTWNPQQPKAASVQAGLSPSITDVSNESQGRKKHEEIVAKVTDWSMGKQHTPLKNLLGEASMETRSKSLNAKEIPVEKDGPAAKDNGSLPKTVSSILAPQKPEGEPAKLEEKAWSSPARYPADIKREKRRVRGRPYWAQFVCCSSVN